ncbi:hypothetical protein HBH79_249820, partial [Parastagonospora nodorum]
GRRRGRNPYLSRGSRCDSLLHVRLGCCVGRDLDPRDALPSRHVAGSPGPVPTHLRRVLHAGDHRHEPSPPSRAVCSCPSLHAG